MDDDESSSVSKSIMNKIFFYKKGCVFSRSSLRVVSAWCVCVCVGCQTEGEKIAI